MWDTYTLNASLSLTSRCILIFPKQAIFKLIPKDELSALPSDENSAEKRANKLWTFFDKGDTGEIQ